LTLYPAHPYAPGVSVLQQDDEGSFSAGRQALLDALQSLEQRAHERAERIVRDAERTARQLTLDSEQRAYQLTTEAEERARQTIAEAEQRAKQVTLEAAQRLADLEQQLAEVRDSLEVTRSQIEEQVVAITGQVEVARASLNTVRQQLTAAGGRVVEAQTRINPVPRPTSGRLGETGGLVSSARIDEVPGPSLNDLRAAVDALKKPRRNEALSDLPADAESETGDETTAEEPTSPRAANG
jgi:vacuolar-type H+-ATPase subunit H